MAFLNGGVPCPPPAMVCSAPFCHEALMSLGFLSLSLHICKMGIILRRLACCGACHSTWNVAAAWNTLSAAVLTERQHLCDATVCPSRAIGARPPAWLGGGMRGDGAVALTIECQPAAVGRARGVHDPARLRASVGGGAAVRPRVGQRDRGRVTAQGPPRAQSQILRVECKAGCVPHSPRVLVPGKRGPLGESAHGVP